MFMTKTKIKTAILYVTFDRQTTITCTQNDQFSLHVSDITTVESRFNDLRFNDIPSVTINIRFPGKSYSKMYGAEPRFNDIRFNDIPGLMMGILFPESKIFPGITIKST